MVSLAAFVFALTAGFLFATAERADATHFRYRVLSWERVDDREVEFTLRLADRSSFYGSVSSGQEWSENIDFGDGSTGTLEGNVLSVNEVDDWFIAEVTGRHTYADDGPFTIDWQSCCTISSLQNSPDSSLRSFSIVDLSDGNRGSPVAAVSPIQAVEADADGMADIPLSAVDPGGGDVTWRLAEQSEVLVTQPPGAEIDPDTGRIRWDTDGLAPGLYLFTAMAADDTGSETQITFIADLDGDAQDDPPTWVDGPPDGTVFTPVLERDREFELAATSGDDREVSILATVIPSFVSCEDVDNPAVEARIRCEIDEDSAAGVWEPAQFLAQTPDGQSAPLRTYTIGVSNYAALGDSFQSGEGIGTYIPETDVDDNQCRRSLQAYPHLLAAEAEIPGGAELGGVSRLRFAACSGAETKNVVDSPDIDPSGVLQHPGENSQWAHLLEPGQDAVQEVVVDRSTSLVTLGIGGNDTGFSEVLSTCLLRNRTESPDWSITDHIQEFSVTGVVSPLRLSCERGWGDTLPERIGELAERPQASTRSRLEQVYRSVMEDTPSIGSELVVLGYPRLFVDGGRNATRCWGVRATEQRWLNDMSDQLNDAIAREARRVGARFIDVAEIFDGEELCTGGGSYLRGIRLPRSEAFHPNADGHQAIADALADELSDRNNEFSVFSGQTVQQAIEVREAVGERIIQFVLRWAGSDIELTVEGPDGTIYGRGAELPEGVDQDNGPRHDSLTIENPEPGEWTVNAFGADVGNEGTMAELEIVETEVPPQGPTAEFDLDVDGAVVRADAGASEPGDGDIVAWQWEFGENGESVDGEQTTFTYTEPGTYEISLLVEDENEQLGIASTDAIIVTQDDVDAADDTPDRVSEPDPGGPGDVAPGDPDDAEVPTPDWPSCTSSAPPPFDDVDADSTHADAIACAAELALVVGYDDGTFRPAHDITRAQFASILDSTLTELGVPLSDDDTAFEDVGGTHAGAIERLATAGIVNGTSETTFAPDRSISRGQLLTMLMRTSEFLELDLPEPDSEGFADTAGTAHESAILMASQAGIASGRPDGSFGPNDDVRRDQAASLVTRWIEWSSTEGR